VLDFLVRPKIEINPLSTGEIAENKPVFSFPEKTMKYRPRLLHQADTFTNCMAIRASIYLSEQPINDLIKSHMPSFGYDAIKTHNPIEVPLTVFDSVSLTLLSLSLLFSFTVLVTRLDILTFNSCLYFYFEELKKRLK
jgi:hypothetical protein